MPRIATFLKNSTLLLFIVCVFYFLFVKNERRKLPEPSGSDLVAPESLVLKDEPREETLVKPEVKQVVKEEVTEEVEEEVKEEDGDLKDSAVVFYSEQGGNSIANKVRT